MCSQLRLTWLLLLPPGSIQEELGIPPRFSCPPPGGTLGSPSALRASQAGPCPQRHAGRLAQHKAGAGGWPMAASANGHQLGCGWGGLAAAWSRQAWQPLPCPPLALCPTSLRFLKPPEGAGRPGWASGLGRRLPSLGPVPPGAFPNARQVEERQAHRLLASPSPSSPPSPTAPAPSGPFQPPGLCTGCAPAWCTLTQSLHASLSFRLHLKGDLR